MAVVFGVGVLGHGISVGVEAASLMDNLEVILLQCLQTTCRLPVGLFEAQEPGQGCLDCAQEELPLVAPGNG